MLWTVLFPFIYIYTIIDGFVSNYFYPAKLPYLYKDIFILLVFFFFCINEHFGKWTGELRRQLDSLVWLSAILFLVIGFAQIFNPSSPGLLIGILGFKVMYLYWVLALMSFVYFNSHQRIISFMKMIFFSAVPVNIFGMAQFIVGPSLFYRIFGPKPHVRIDIAAVGDYSSEQSFLRVIGTFGSSGQYGNFLVVNAIFGFVLLFSEHLRRETKWMLIALQILNFTALLASGSRSSFTFLILSLFLFFMLCRQARTGGISILLTGVILFGAFQFLGGKVVSRYRSLSQINMVKDRTTGVTLKMFENLLERYPMGRGLGSASTAATHLSAAESSSYAFIENYPSKLQAEMGIVGVICYYLFTMALIMRWFGSWLKWINEPDYILAALITGYCMTQFLIAGVFFIVDAPPVPIFLWTFVGMIARMTHSSWESPNSEALSRPVY